VNHTKREGSTEGCRDSSTRPVPIERTALP
jgi:hypothetical protein